MKKKLLCLFLLFNLLWTMKAENTFQLRFSDVFCVENTLTHDFYYSVDPQLVDKTVIVTYESEDIKELYIDGQLCAQNSEYVFENLRDKKLYKIKTVSFDNQENIFNLILTTMPLVLIDSGSAEIIKDKRTTCDFIVIDPAGRTNGGEIVFKHKAGVKVRGASSSYYPKKPYSVELQDGDGNEVDASVLGLREDGDWILDAMYIDHARMRNRLCTDIWNSFNNVPHIADEPDAHNGTRGYFVEVFLNGMYNGLYCLTEKIDRKQLKLKKYKDNTFKGVSYKSNSWDTPLANGVYDKNEPIDGLLWCGYESEYPGEEGLAGWEYLQHFMDFVSFSYNNDNELFEAELEKHIYMDNIIDYILFLNSVMAIDNAVKNMFLSVYNVQKEERFFITPWDLDATFGRSYEGSLLNRYGFSDNLTNSNMLFRRLFTQNPCNFIERLENRWNELKINQLSVETVTKRINDYKDLLLSSGAFERELAMWPEKCTEIISEAQFMINWYAQNFDVIDRYIDLTVSSLEKNVNDSFTKVSVDGNNVLMIESLTGEPINVEIVTSSGKCIAMKSNVYFFTADLLAHGVYLIKVNGKSGTVVRKVIL